MNVAVASESKVWDTFLSSQTYRPFLQSWTMGEVYRDVSQEPIRLIVEENGEIQAICQAFIVPARRGRHLSIPYGPVISCKIQDTRYKLLVDSLITELTTIAKQNRCSFIRMSPFWPLSAIRYPLSAAIPSPLHLLAEHIWYLPLVTPNPWEAIQQKTNNQQLITNNQSTALTEETLLMAMRKTTRNLIRRAEKDGVEIVASLDPVKDVETFITLHDETRKRHGFTPYTNAFFRAQVKHFAPRNECTVYCARYQGETIAASIHMHCFGETSYHHGASSGTHQKVPASYLLQWTAIKDALKRGDQIYNFWGIAPTIEQRSTNSDQQESPSLKAQSSKLKAHPFAGVTLFKTGFGGNLFPLVHCMDLPLSPSYTLTRMIEQWRKWRRGF